MAQRGEAGKALGVQLIASAIGGMFAAVCMLMLQPSADPGCPELWPLGTVCHLLHGPVHPDKPGRRQCPASTIISGLLGLLLACIGLDPLLGVPRLTFGTRFLTSGIEMIPVMIGFFAVTEVLKQIQQAFQARRLSPARTARRIMSAKMPTLKEMWSLVRSRELESLAL